MKPFFIEIKERKKRIQKELPSLYYKIIIEFQFQGDTTFHLQVTIITKKRTTNAGLLLLDVALDSNKIFFLFRESFYLDI
jgi:hypothetical protein